MQRKASITSVLARWSSSTNEVSSTSLDAIQSLDVTLVLRTCLNFPRWRRLEEPLTKMGSAPDAQLYDPVFLILLFAQMLAEDPPSSAFAWVELFRTNVVSLLIKAISSKCGGIREVALCQIAALWQHLEVMYWSSLRELVANAGGFLARRLARKTACPPHLDSVKGCAPIPFRAREAASATTIIYDACSLACLARRLLSIEFHLSDDRSVPIAAS